MKVLDYSLSVPCLLVSPFSHVPPPPHFAHVNMSGRVACACGRGHMWAPHGTNRFIKHNSFGHNLSPPGTNLCHARWMMRAASFLLSCSLSRCSRRVVDRGASDLGWASLEGRLRSKDELLLNETVWALTKAFSEVCSLWFGCFCREVCALLLPEALRHPSLFLHSLALASLWSTVETGVEGDGVSEEDRSRTLGLVGGVGFRLGGSLQLPGDRSSFSLVVGEDSASQLKASGASARSAALLLLGLFFWAGGEGEKVFLIFDLFS